MTQPEVRSGRMLGAILLNPPLTTGTATWRHLRVAAEVLGCDDVQIANLFAIPTASVVEINEVGRSFESWETARPELERVVETSAELIAGWGVSGLHGPAAKHRRDQTEWVLQRVTALGLGNLWTLKGEPRHPSRWHQYVSDRHGHASGTSFPDRLKSVLQLIDCRAAHPWPHRSDNAAA